MRVRLKGLNFTRKRLSSGQVVTYWYAWRGGPRLPGQPGEAEFIAAYNEAVRTKAKVPAGTLLALMQAYQQSQDFLGLAERTRFDYVRQIKRIETTFGTLPLAILPEPRVRGDFMDWRDDLAKSSLRQADYAWAVLALILAWGLDRGKIAVNPCTKGGRLYRGSRADKIWTADDEAAFLAAAPAHLHLPLLLALWTGQRQGDLLCLPWSAYDGAKIRLRQSKTGVRVVIPVGAPLKAALDATRKKGPLVLVNTDGMAWTEDGFRSSWRKACVKAGIVGVTFNDLRGTAVTRLALVGCTEAEIVTLTGHMLGDVRAVLDAHYLHRDPALAESAIRKLETGTGSQTTIQTGLPGSAAPDLVRS